MFLNIKRAGFIIDDNDRESGRERECIVKCQTRRISTVLSSILHFYLFYSEIPKFLRETTHRIFGFSTSAANKIDRVWTMTFDCPSAIFQFAAFRGAIRSVFSERTYLRKSRPPNRDTRWEARRNEGRWDAASQRTLIGRGLKCGAHLPRLPMEFPASSMFHDSFQRALQRGTRARARARIGRVKAECFQPSYSTRNLIRANAWNRDTRTHRVESALALSYLEL